MTTQPSGFDVLSKARYVSLTTFRKNGDPVPTPVWIAPDGDQLVFISIDQTGKTKRLAHTPAVVLCPCDFRGQVADDAPSYTATATVGRTEQEISLVRRAIEQKYLVARVFHVVQCAARRIGRSTPRAAIRITLD